MSEFQTYKKDLTVFRTVDTDFAQALESLQVGQIAVSIERFAFTANNVTYGAAGDTIGYWKFFPASDNRDDDWGCLPVWGFAKIEASKVDGLSVGERIYGYFPPADFLVMQPGKISAPRFVDTASHRLELPAVYNNYMRLTAEQDYDASTDDLRALLNPLHVTSFCLCDALEDEGYHGAEQVVIVSASSKTAIGLAQGIADLPAAPPVVGLTSAANKGFVKSLGCYDSVITYDQLDALDASLATVMVDMAGNRSVLGRVHGTLGDKLLSCVSVGMTHWETLAEKDPMANQINRERSHFFFAPAHIQKRIADWGQVGFNERSQAFMNRRMTQSQSWMSIAIVEGFADFADIYTDVVSGKISPNEGLIVLP